MSALWRIWRAPWVARVRGSRDWVIALIWILLVAKAATDHVLYRRPAMVAAAALLAAVGFLWSLLPNALWLARDARMLGLPGIGRDTKWVLPLYAAASIVVPALIVGVVFGHLDTWLVLLAFDAATALSLSVLPPLITLLLFGAAFPAYMLSWVQPSLPGMPGFFSWSLPTMIVLGIAAVTMWNMLRRASPAAFLQRSARTQLPLRQLPMRRLAGFSYVSPYPVRDQPRQHGPLQRVGPGFAVRSIALVCNRASWSTRRRRTMTTALVLSVPTAARLGLWWYGKPATIVFMQLALLCVGIGICKAPQGFVHNLGLRLRSGVADRALLALLPGLGQPQTLRRAALRAGMQPALRFAVGMAIASGLGFAVLRAPWVYYVYLALMVACAALLQGAFVAHLLAGAPVRKAIAETLEYSLYVPLFVTAFGGWQASHDLHAFAEWPSWPALGCVALWLLWCAAFAVLAVRGWRTLQQKPHPFLEFRQRKDSRRRFAARR